VMDSTQPQAIVTAGHEESKADTAPRGTSHRRFRKRPPQVDQLQTHTDYYLPTIRARAAVNCVPASDTSGAWHHRCMEGHVSMLDEVLPPGQGQDAGHGLFVTERLTADRLSVFAKEQRSAMRPHFLGNIVTLSGDQPGYAQGSGCCGFYFVLWPIDALADGYCIVLRHIVCGSYVVWVRLMLLDIQTNLWLC
jgi:hypothetical protein